MECRKVQRCTSLMNCKPFDAFLLELYCTSTLSGNSVDAAMTIRKLIYASLFLLLVGIAAAYLVPRGRFQVEQSFFKLMTKDVHITSGENIDDIIAEFPTIDRANLPTDFLERTKIGGSKFSKLSPRKFFVIRKRDLYRRVAGHLRIRDLFAVGGYERSLFYFSREPLYWGIDPDILHKVLELRSALEDKGYDGAAFHCNYGYRHPTLNEAVGGAPRSRHIAGDALDLVIDDINRDGLINAEDKDIVLNICEREIIGNKGGIGRYPGTQVVHIDLRGRRARWDSY